MSDQKKKSERNKVDSEYHEVNYERKSKSADSKKVSASVMWTGGPDAVCPSNNFFAEKLTDAVQLRISSYDYTDYKPISLYGQFYKTVSENPQHPALGITCS